MQRARGICLVAVLVIAAALLSLPWWGNSVQTLFAANTGPGVKLQITNVSITGDNHPVVTFTITDGQGNALQTSDLDANSLRYTIARIDTDPNTGLTSYFNYITTSATGQPVTVNGKALQPALGTITVPNGAGDTTGTLTAAGGGTYNYTFGTALPADYPKTATHEVGIQATRGGRKYASNDVFSFVPAGGTPITRQVVNIDNCNQCHDTLAVHGGGRVDTKLCVLCHTPQNVDPTSGNSLDFKVMIHRIHDASNLPSVKAGNPFFIGNANHNFSDVKFPQDVRNCTTCHKDAPQADNWKNAPNAAACTACHDNVNPITGENHAGGAQTDATCKNCHTNSMTSEFDLSVPGAHVIPAASSQLRGINFDLISFTDTQPGQKPTVVFDIKDNAGNFVAPSDMNRIALTVAGPTYDYQTEPPITELVDKATPNGDGTYSYTFTAPIPVEASGTWAVGIEGNLAETIKGPGGQDLTVNDAGFNKVLYGAVTDPVPMPRKQIVDRNNCNQCHKDLGSPVGLSIHGGNRRNTEYCVMCHNPNHTDAKDRPADQMPPVTVDFKFMIHRIHTGAQGATPYTVGTTSFNDVRFPGDRRDCVKCHVPGSNLIDFLHSGAQPTIVRQAQTPATTITGHLVNNTAPIVSTTQPITSACTGCHDDSATKDHAALQTAPDGTETCIVCHGESADFAVSKVHARP